MVWNKAVTMSDCHYTIIVAIRIHNNINNIIVISTKKIFFFNEDSVYTVT